MRYQPENTLIIGLTPPPNLPDATEICHLLDPIVLSVASYGAGGKQVPTFHHPECVLAHVRVAPLIADLEGSRKVAGFMGHGAIMFCSFCLCTSDQLEDLNIHSWQLRNSTEVRTQAQEWLHLTTKVAKNAQAKSTGVRWTPLHRLPYWDPVKHVVLGYMHNWLEGILQHHLRALWGIGRDETEKKKVEEIEKDEDLTEGDVSDSADELDGLSQEAMNNDAEAAAIMSQSTPPPISPSPSTSSISSTTISSGSSSTATPTQATVNPYNFDSDSDDDMDDDDDLDYVPLETKYNFTDAELQAIRNCIRDVSLPTWVNRPPINLGEPVHGKLKAQEYLILFTCIFPLIIPEFWHTTAATNTDWEHFHCFYHLVAATNIVSSFKVSNADADTYTQHYIKYRAAIQKLFPYRQSKPNHHYAMHNADQMKYWGPLPSFSEFPGERMNGMLQGIKTNRRLSMFYS